MKYFVSVILIITSIFTVFGQKKRSVKTTNKPVISKSQNAAKLKDVISQAQNLYFQGVSFLAEGKGIEAQKSFDKAKLLVSSAKVADIEQPKLAEFYEKLVNSIYLAQNGDTPPPKSIAESSPNSPLDPINDLSSNRTNEYKSIPVPTPTPFTPVTPDIYKENYRVPGIPNTVSSYEEKKRLPNTTSLTIQGVLSNLTFLILDKSLISILMEGGLNPLEKTKNGREYDLIETFYKSLKDSSSEKYLAFRAQAYNLINKHKIKELQTNYSGYATTDLPFGTYYFVTAAWFKSSGFDKSTKYFWDMEFVLNKDEQTFQAGTMQAKYIFK